MGLNDIKKVNVVEEVKQKSVTVSDLIHQCNLAAEGMSVHNPHKMLLVNCAYALKQMAGRLYDYEHPEADPNATIN